MGTNCAPLIGDLFIFCYEREFMASLSYNKEAEIIQALTLHLKYQNDLLNINNPYFESMVSQMYPSELQLNEANASGAEALFLNYIYLFQTDLFHPKFMIKPMIL